MSQKHEWPFRTGSRIDGSALADVCAFLLLSVYPHLVSEDLRCSFPRYSLKARRSTAISVADLWTESPVTYTEGKETRRNEAGLLKHLLVGLSNPVSGLRSVHSERGQATQVSFHSPASAICVPCTPSQGHGCPSNHHPLLPGLLWLKPPWTLLLLFTVSRFYQNHTCMWQFS